MSKSVSKAMLHTLNAELGAAHPIPTPTRAINSVDEVTRKLAGIPSESPDEIDKLKEALSLISPDVPRGDGSIFLSSSITSNDYWLGVIWAIRGLDWPCGEKIARKWSMQSDRYTEDGFDRVWAEYDPNHRDPIGIGSLYKLASFLEDEEWEGLKESAVSSEITEDNGYSPSPFEDESQSTEDVFKSADMETDIDPDDIFSPSKKSPLASLAKLSVTGSSRELKKKMLADEFVMRGISILGQWTTLYAAPNTGKTLLSIWLLREQIQSGLIDASKVYYVNADDHYRGMVAKTEIAEGFGMQMLVPNHNGFTVDQVTTLMTGLANADEAQGVVLVLDTLKKFTDLMDKRAASAFGVIARGFVSAGGTLITLAHVNKHPDAEGRGIYSGTSDIVDDCDCFYVIDQVGVVDNILSRTHTVEFANKKCRGDVSPTLGFSFERCTGQDYSDLLGSVKRLDSTEVNDTKRSAGIRKALEGNAEIIDAVCIAINSGIITKAKIIKAVNESAGETNGRVRKVLDDHTGNSYAQGDRWNCRPGDHNARLYSILPPTP